MEKKGKKGHVKDHGGAKAETVEDFFKFPRTRHIYNAGGSSVGRDDLLMDAHEAAVFHSNPLVVEEKVDGSNLGISITEDYKVIFQNRGKLISSASGSQWRQLDEWVSAHPGLWQVLTSPSLLLFGEWCYARHSIEYTRLPDYFIVFDLYDKTAQHFVSRAELERRLEGSGLALVRQIGQAARLYPHGRDELLLLLETDSAYYDGKVEGVYLRIDRGAVSGERGKIVRPEFLQNMDDGEHWATQDLVKNTVLYQ